MGSTVGAGLGCSTDMRVIAMFAVLAVSSCGAKQVKNKHEFVLFDPFSTKTNLPSPSSTYAVQNRSPRLKISNFAFDPFTPFPELTSTTVRPTTATTPIPTPPSHTLPLTEAPTNLATPSHPTLSPFTLTLRKLTKGKKTKSSESPDVTSVKEEKSPAETKESVFGTKYNVNPVSSLTPANTADWVASILARTTRRTTRRPTTVPPTSPPTASPTLSPSSTSQHQQQDRALQIFVPELQTQGPPSGHRFQSNHQQQSQPHFQGVNQQQRFSQQHQQQSLTPQHEQFRSQQQQFSSNRGQFVQPQSR